MGPPPAAPPPPPGGRHLVLLHSPLVHASFWQPVADRLNRSGLRTHAPMLPSLEYSYAPYWLAHAAGIAQALPRTGEVVLAAHGTAGVLLPAIGKLQRSRVAPRVRGPVPSGPAPATGTGTGGHDALAEAVTSRIVGYLLVDCDLPRDGASPLDLWDDPAAAARLRAAVGTGYLPAWTADELAPAITDPDLRARFCATLPRVPMHVYDEPVMVPPGWPDAPCAYLRLSGGGHADAWQHAQAHGWPRQALGPHHFAPLTDPGTVASAVAGLCDAL